MVVSTESVRKDPELQDPPCDCLPPCTDEWFEPEISYSSFPGHGFGLSRTYKRVADRLGLDRNNFDVHGPIGEDFKLILFPIYPQNQNNNKCV